MFTLRLFHQDDPFSEIDSHPLYGGELTIGRGDAADWTIEDEERALSRLHCTLTLRDGRLSLADTSSNGVFVGSDRRRADPGRPMAVAPGETLRMGTYLVFVDKDEPAAKAFEAPFRQPVLTLGESAESIDVPSDWMTFERRGPAAPSEGGLFDAFCEGAGLDASAFSGEAPEEVMRRLGGVYRQMVLGLSDLMTERTTAKGEFQLERTTVRSMGNNPFRWAQAHRVAVDLLKAREDGFLSGQAAVRTSFEDLKKHLLCMLSGLRAAVSSTLDTLSPEAVEEQVAIRSFLGRGAAWGEYTRRHAEFKRLAGADPDSPVNREFRNAYERRLQELEATGANG